MSGFLQKLFPTVGVILMVGLTSLSTVLGASKIVHTVNEVPTVEDEVPVSEVLSEQIVEVPDISLITETPTPTPTVKKTVVKKAKVTPKPTTTQNTLISSNTSSAQCIVTIFGAKYDVAPLRNTHSGGDVFVCGTDQTSLYQGRHGTNLAMMEKYKIDSIPASIPTVTPTPTTSLGNSTTRCLITLFGSQYDITDLQRTHSGGNLFTCGNDQSSLYQSRHGTNVTMMQRYKVTSSSPQPTQVPSIPTPTPRPSTPTPTSTPRITPTPTPRRTPTPTRPRYWDEDSDDREDLYDDDDDEEDDD